MRTTRRRITIGLGLLLAVAMIPMAAFAAGGTFTDDEMSVFEADIEWLADAEVTLGCNPPTNDQFCPDDNVKREQMAAFMRRFARYLGAEDGIVSEADHAVTADSATEAGDADMLGGTPSADFYTKAEINAAIAAIALQGAYTVEEVNTINPSTTMFMGVSCNAGDLMVGGGYQTLHPDTFLFEHNRPSLSGQTWEVAAFNDDVSPWDVTIYVRCLDLTP